MRTCFCAQYSPFCATLGLMHVHRTTYVYLQCGRVRIMLTSVRSNSHAHNDVAPWPITATPTPLAERSQAWLLVMHTQAGSS
jgi:hypothetical protein